MKHDLKLNALAEARAKATADYEQKIAQINRVAKAYETAGVLAQKWIDGREGREARVWLWDVSVSLYFGLAKGEIFADAAEAYEEAEQALRATFPAAWKGSWSALEDSSTEAEACRGSTLDLAPERGWSWLDGARVYLHVYAKVGDGAACNVVRIGERQVPDYGSYHDRPLRTEPVFKAVCPGDPLPIERRA